MHNISICNWITLPKRKQVDFMKGEIEFLKELEDEEDEDKEEDR
jgi:hypothetical protein